MSLSLEAIVLMFCLPEGRLVVDRQLAGVVGMLPAGVGDRCREVAPRGSPVKH